MATPTVNFPAFRQLGAPWLWGSFVGRTGGGIFMDHRGEVEINVKEFLEGFTYQFVDPSIPGVLLGTLLINIM